MASEFERLQIKYESVDALVGVLQDAATRLRDLNAAEPDDPDTFTPMLRKIEELLDGSPDGLVELARDLEAARDDARERLHDEVTLAWLPGPNAETPEEHPFEARADSLHEGKRCARNLVFSGAAREVLVTRGGVTLHRVQRQGDDVIEIPTKG